MGTSVCAVICVSCACTSLWGVVFVPRCALLAFLIDCVFPGGFRQLRTFCPGLMMRRSVARRASSHSSSVVPPLTSSLGSIKDYFVGSDEEFPLRYPTRILWFFEDTWRVRHWSSLRKAKNQHPGRTLRKRCVLLFAMRFFHHGCSTLLAQSCRDTEDHRSAVPW